MGAYEQQRKMSSEILTEAISKSERLFTEHVRATYRKTPILAGEGSSCLIAVIQGEELYVVNLGDCRAVMGVSVKPNKILRVVVGDSVRTQKIRAEQLTEDHNVNIEEVRKEVQAEHPNDPNILEKRNGILYLREITQVSRGLGHACLKHPDLAITPIINNPITRAVLRCDPDVYNRTMTQSDRFLILASHGFWIHMTNEDAVNTVFKHPHAGIAKRLLTQAMKKAARKKERGYDSVKEMLQMKRIEIHDDMTVAVIFIDHEWLKRESPVHQVSVKGFTAGPSSSGTDKPGPSNSGADTIGFLAYSRRKNQGLVIMIN